jgi:toxin ParE1/3/4
MIREVIIRPEAEAEMTEAYDWYEDRVPGLGSGFLLSVDAILHAIARTPQRYPVVHKGIRRALTRRFPFEVFFLDGESRVVVLAVFHVKRNPENWQERV